MPFASTAPKRTRKAKPQPKPHGIAEASPSEPLESATVEWPHHYATSVPGSALPNRAQSASNNTTSYKRLAQLRAGSFQATLSSTPPPPNLRCSCTAASRRFATPRNINRPDILPAAWYSRQACLHGCCSISQCTGVEEPFCPGPMRKRNMRALAPPEGSSLP